MDDVDRKLISQLQIDGLTTLEELAKSVKYTSMGVRKRLQRLLDRSINERIKRTVAELKKLDPKLVAPTHCTGWRGAYAIFKSMPDAFVSNSVGNLYQF